MASKAQPLYKRCKKGVHKSGAKKGRLMQGYIWPGGGKCPVKGVVGGKKAKASPKKRSRKPSRHSVAYRSQAAAAGRYGAGAEAFIRRMKMTKSSGARPPASYSQQASALQRIYGRSGSMSGARRSRPVRGRRRRRR